MSNDYFVQTAQKPSPMAWQRYQPFAPVALPKREFMENARAIWDRLGLPALEPQSPWHGYDLGVWPEHLERQAQMATRSEYFDFADELVQQRRKDVNMNDPVTHDPKA